MVERAEVRRWNKAVHKTEQMFLREHGFLPDEEFDLTLEGGKYVQQSKKKNRRTRHDE